MVLIFRLITVFTAKKWHLLPRCFSLAEMCLETSRQIYRNSVPLFVNLQKNAYKSCRPLSFWVSNLIQRVNFFNTWAKVAYTTIHHR